MILVMSSTTETISDLESLPLASPENIQQLYSKIREDIIDGSYVYKSLLSSGAFGKAYHIQIQHGFNTVTDVILKEISYKEPEMIVDGCIQSKNHTNIISANIEINILKYIRAMSGYERPDILTYIDDYIDYKNKSINIITLAFISKKIIKDNMGNDTIDIKIAPTLESFLKDNIISFEDMLTIGYNILNAFDYLHSIDITHNDIKPANILINEGSLEIHVIDFGGACKDNYCIGLHSPAYDHPQSSYVYNNKIGGRNKNINLDIYSIGKVLEKLYDKVDLKLDNNCHNMVKLLIKAMLNINISSNISMNKFKEYFIEIQQCSGQTS